MKLYPQVAEALLHADGKALATTGPHGINVIPVSTIKIVDGKIWLINYFFGKTLRNILAEPRAALACFKGLSGYQIKGSASYLEEGREFEDAKTWVAGILPERIVKGLIILDPEEIFDVTPGADQS